MKKGTVIDEKIIKVDYEDEMKNSFIDYAMSVIMERALPDVRDGLKPVHRRILYAMSELNLDPSKAYRKCARIVGDVLGKYHPHGDASIYEALVRMSQDFSLLVPLVQGHGNFGSIDGDGAAAMRYTEAKLSYASTEFLQDLEKRVVNFRDNFDATLQEPTVLPTHIPNLLVNGTVGIAVGMATSIPSHNLGEVIKATIDYIDNPNITIPKLLKSIKGPDFPTGGIVTNKNDLQEIYENGNGKLRIRAKIEVEDAGHGKTNLVVTEIPYTSSGSKTKLLEKIIELVRDKKVDELSNVQDESSKEGIRIVLEVKRGVNIDNLLNKLYKKTPLEDTMSVNFLALVEIAPDRYEPKVLNLKQIIEYFVAFQREITTRKYQYLLDKADEKEEVLEGLIKAHDIIDLIVEVLRGSQDVRMAKDCMMFGKTDGIRFKTKKSEKDATKLNFTERQTLAILDMRLQKLINLELQKLMEDLNETKKAIQFYQEVLGNESKLMEVIKEYLNEIKKNYATKRRTAIEEVGVVDYVEEFKEEELYVLVDRFNYGKTVEPANYNRTNEETVKDFKYIFSTKNTDKLCMFTNEGNLFQIKLTDMPKAKVKDKGVPLVTLAKIGKQEELVYVDTGNSVKKNKFLFTTENGFIKITDGNEFESNRTCIASTKLDENDKVVAVQPLNSDEPYQYALLVSAQGYALKFDLKSVSELKRNSKGVKTMILTEGDAVQEVYLLKANDNFTIKVNGKEIAVKSIKQRRRNQMGVKL